MTDPLWFKSSDDLRIAYDDRGSDSARPPVVLHHGFAASGFLNWVAPGVVDALVASGRRVINIDARGHGRSDKPHDPSFYGEAKMAADVSTLIDTLGVDEIDLVGYSMGAIVSLIVASQEHRVRRMVVGGIGAGVIERGGVDTRALDPKALQVAMLAEDQASITDAAARAFRAFADSTGADRLALAAHVASIRRLPIPLENIKTPTLVLVGRDDPLAMRPHVLSAAIDGAELRVIDGDHLGAVGVPAFAPAIVDFVNGS